MKPDESHYPENQRGRLWRWFWRYCYRMVRPLYEQSPHLGYGFMIFLNEYLTFHGVPPLAIGYFLNSGERVYLTVKKESDPTE